MNKEVLAWDLFEMLENKSLYALRDVPISFSSIDEYLDIFEPLLLEECRAQTLRSLGEAENVEHHLYLEAAEPAEPFRMIRFEVPTQQDSGERERVFLDQVPTISRPRSVTTTTRHHHHQTPPPPVTTIT